MKPVQSYMDVSLTLTEVGYDMKIYNMILTLSLYLCVTVLFSGFSKSMQWKSTVSRLQHKNAIQIN